LLCTTEQYVVVKAGTIQ